MSDENMPTKIYAVDMASSGGWTIGKWCTLKCSDNKTEYILATPAHALIEQMAEALELIATSRGLFDWQKTLRASKCSPRRL